MNATVEPISVSIEDGRRAIGVGRTKFYELIDDGQVETIKLGTRTLVKWDSLKRLIHGEAA